MRKILILISLLTVTTIAVAVLYFSTLGISTRSNDKALAFIPGDAAMVAGFRNEKAFYDIFRDYQLFSAVLGTVHTEELRQLQQLLLLRPGIMEAAEGQNIFLSFHTEKQDGISLLLLMTLSDKADKNDLVDILLQPDETFNAIKITLSGKTVMQVTLTALKKSFYLFVGDGMAIGSFSRSVLQRSLERPPQSRIGKEFIREISAGSRQTEASPVNLFINHHAAASFLTLLVKGKLNGNFGLLGGMSGQTTLNLNYKSDALMFSGISKPDTASHSYLDLFLRQTPVPLTLQQTFPAATANYVAFGTSSYNEFYQALHQLLARRGELARLETQYKLLRNSTGFDVEQQLKPLIGNEFAMIQLADQQKIGIVKIQNTQALSAALAQVSSPVTENLFQLKNANIPYYFFGDPFRAFARPYYTITDSYLVIANAASTVNRFMSDYSSAKLLTRSADFTSFNQFVAAQSNVSMFFHTANSKSIVRSDLKLPYADAFSDQAYGLKNFFGWQWQWSGDGDHFFTNLYAGYADTASSPMQLAWKYRLNAQIANTPQVFSDEQGSPFLVVQDKVNNLYALSPEGKKRWALQLTGRLTGPITQLTDRSLVCTTADYLYRLNTGGSMMAGFPRKLALRASAGATFSSIDPAAAIIFIPCGDMIAAVDASGHDVPGWNKNTGGQLVQELKIATVNETSYVTACTENGKFTVFDLSGKIVTRAADPTPTPQYRNPVTIQNGADLKSTFMVTTNQAGQLVTVNLEGRMNVKNMGSWSAGHFFDTYNIANDESKELIYLDNNQLYVFGADSNLVFNYEFGHNILSRPEFFSMESQSYQLGVASASDQLVYLFNDDGSILKGFPFHCLPDFYTGTLDKGRARYFICGKTDNYLYVYKL
ncbi:chromate resistance protein [Hufsiella ginkgonis]|uniref:PQQ-binding-like beta-propeller repeat protein n=1 Tax=Hufsiella ginkgonis TaxID=2695274 RepID=A0A7K1XYV7_9SPHI|nr:chromate resistance protein [Hufsiella ginkgonis]MXV15929.1 hypothetical protein [Hufsiella ginkgonis]